MLGVRLRLYHHHDGARVAYRETGTGPAIALLHSLGLSHREDRPRHSYTPDWLAEVIAGFCREVAGPRPLLAGHDIGAELALRAVTTGRLQPASLVLMSNRLHRRDEFAGKRAAWRAACRVAALPGLDRLLAHGATFVFRPSVGERLSAQRNPATRDLVRKRSPIAGIRGDGGAFCGRHALSRHSVDLPHQRT